MRGIFLWHELKILKFHREYERVLNCIIISILNSISTSHRHPFFIITNVLSVSRDLSHPFLTFYFNPNLHHFINTTCNLIHFLSMTIDTKFMELIGVFLNYLRFVNYNVSCWEGDWDERKISNNYKGMDHFTNPRLI